MIVSLAERRLTEALDRWRDRGAVARFWLRDDDAVEPTSALDRFLATTGSAGIPAVLAVIPENTGIALAERLADHSEINVAVHGWSHVNHAPANEKKQELGVHRPAEAVLSELAGGVEKLQALHGERFLPMLVPPWNRIAPSLIPVLPALGFECLSVFGPEKARGIPEINTHVDVIDWHGTRGGRDASVLMSEIAGRLDGMGDDEVMGLLTHHLVHDAAVDDFLYRLFAVTADHPGCIWICGRALLGGL
jgi:peptidoglycan/xylan/chitin deacetylase (PgdA/CDA1 family)